MDLVKGLRKAAGTEIFGVADALAYGEKAPPGHRPAEYLADARSIVLLGVRMLDLPLDEIPATRKEYTVNFHMANTRLNHALFDAAGYLQSQGHKVFPVPYLEMPGWNLDKRPVLMLKALRHLIAVPRVHDMLNARVLWENLSFRHMAAEAGLGEIGVNNLLLTPEHGARVRFVALLTDAELPAGKPREPVLCSSERCGHACVKACPAGALSEDGRGTDKAACLKYYIKLGLPGMNGVRCGLCVARCPVYRPRFREGRKNSPA
ncbi:MAG: epoxyqueuosine reductase [Actinobacteria bacterium]|jgi:epoxyqueuosine reductase QueG|nr:MAG: epoxyqueuosine reductase [Actinomycetota bacterium]